MENFISQAFRSDDDLGPDVQAGHYDSVLDDAIILPQIWEFLVKLGARVTMHMWPMDSPEPSDPEMHPSPRSSDSNIEHPIPEIYNSKSVSPREASSQSSFSPPGPQHPRDRIPPPVPDAPLSPHESARSTAWRAELMPPAPSPRSSSIVGSEEPELDESVSRRSRSRRSNTISSYSIRSNMTTPEPPTSRPEPRRHFTVIPLAFRCWLRIRTGLARTISNSNLSEARNSNEMVER